jgi:hypothetical protein
MWGFAARQYPSQGTIDPLYARVLVLEGGAKRIALVTVDLGRSFGPDSLSRIRSTAAKNDNIALRLPPPPILSQGQWFQTTIRTTEPDGSLDFTDEILEFRFRWDSATFYDAYLRTWGPQHADQYFPGTAAAVPTPVSTVLISNVSPSQCCPASHSSNFSRIGENAVPCPTVFLWGMPTDISCTFRPSEQRLGAVMALPAEVRGPRWALASESSTTPSFRPTEC